MSSVNFERVLGRDRPALGEVDQFVGELDPCSRVQVRRLVSLRPVCAQR